jgi:hypothetical protein
VVAATHDEVAQGPNWASIGLAHEALVGVKHSGASCVGKGLRC